MKVIPIIYNKDSYKYSLQLSICEFYLTTCIKLKGTSHRNHPIHTKRFEHVTIINMNVIVTRPDNHKQERER
jgi:hypothetical protein